MDLVRDAAQLVQIPSQATAPAFVLSVAQASSS